MLRLYDLYHRARSSWNNCRSIISFSASSRRYTQGSSQVRTQGPPFEILYFGRDVFSCAVLEQLYAAKDLWQQITLITQPDTKAGRRGSQLSISPLKLLGERLRLPVHSIPTDKPAFRHWQPPAPFSELPPSPSRVLVTASFGRILSKQLLSHFPPGRRLNVHPSLLPEYRGPAPIQHALLDGLKETGVCVIEMMEYKKGIDVGEIWGQRTVPIPEDAAFPSLRDSLAVEGGQLLVSVLRQMMAGTASSVPQRADDTAKHARMITADDAQLDFQSMTASAIVQRHKAISHQKAIFTRLKTGKTLQLHDPIVFQNPPDTILSLIPEVGVALYEPHNDSLIVRCASNTVLSVRRVQQQDKKAMDAKPWWNGIRPEMRREPHADSGPIMFI